MARRILVPLDGSSLAEGALPFAATLARGLPADLVLLHAIWIPPDVREIMDESTVKLNVIVDEPISEADDYLGELAGHLRDESLNVLHAVRRGPAAEVILQYAGQASINQIVMATHGFSGVKRWTHGSVAERVLQTARVPLVLVRIGERGLAEARQPPMLCRRILVPLDGSSVAEQILPTVTTFAEALRAELILFQVPIAHVYGWMTGEWYVPIQGVLDTAEQDAHGYLSTVADRLKQQDLDVVTATSIGSVADCIIDYAEANNVDLIAMSTHGRTGLARWALGSVADRVLRAGHTPILPVRMQ